MIDIIALYVVPLILVATFFFGVEWATESRDWHIAILTGIIWPVIVLQLTLLSWLDVYIGDEWRRIKKWWKHYKCEHDKQETAWEDYSYACDNCGKLWE